MPPRTFLKDYEALAADFTVREGAEKEVAVRTTANRHALEEEGRIRGRILIAIRLWQYCAASYLSKRLRNSVLFAGVQA